MIAVTIDELETFVSIARRGGFARAAESLHRSQPAISRRVEMLEQQLGSPLFERVRGGVILTEAGRTLLPYAEAALAGLKDGAEAVRGLARGELGAVSVALVGTLASTRFAGMLRQFAQRHPSVKLELRTANSQEVSDLVRRGEATLGLRYFTDTDPGLVSEQVTEEALVLACAPDHRLAGRRVREPGVLAGERWVAFPPRAGGASPSPPRSSSGSPRPASRRRRSSASTASPRRSGWSRRGSGSRSSSRAAYRKSCAWAPSRSSTRPRCGAACR